MRATILGILAACTLASSAMSHAPGDILLATSARAQEATAPNPERPAPAAVTRILLVDALSSADRDIAHAVDAIASRTDITEATGIALGQELARDWKPSGENLAAIQSRTKAALLKGEIEGAVLPLTAFLRQSALFGADQIPFLVVDATSNTRLIDLLTPLIDDRLAEHGLALIGLLPMRPIGLRGTVRARKAFPRKIAVSDAAGRRLAELIGADAIATPASQMHKTPIEASYTGVAELGTPSGPPPDPRNTPDTSDPPDHRQLLAVASWPLAMIVVRRDLVTRRLDPVRNLLWPEVARQAEAIRRRWQTSMASPYWPPAETRLLAPPAATGDQASSQVQGNDRSQHDPAALHQGHRPQEPAAAGRTARNSPAAGLQAPDVSTASLRSAGMTMAREWAVGAGADGFTLLQALGLNIRKDR